MTTSGTTGHLHLTGRRLTAGRAAWLAAVVVSLLIAGYGVTTFPNELRQGSTGIEFLCLPTGAARIMTVAAGSPAAKVGIRPDEAVIAVNATKLTPENCQTTFDQLPKDYASTVKFTVRSAGAVTHEYTLARTIPRTNAMRAFLNLGASLDTAVIGTVILEAVALLLFWAFGIIVSLERHDDGIALLAAALLIAGGVRFSGMLGANTFTSPLDMFISVYAIFLYLFLALFPDGRFAPRWTTGLWLAYSVLVVSAWIKPIFIGKTAFQVLDLSFLVVIVLTQVYRFRRVSTPAQRQQTKWVVFGFVVAVIGFYLFRVVGLLGITLSPEVDAVTTFVSRLATLVAPLSIGLAALRFRLFDIDLVINRSLVYGTVTLLLVTIFAGVAVLLQSLLGSTAAFAVSAVAAGILFNPLRKQLQRLVDRRVYGFRFDLYELRRAQKLQSITNRGLYTGRMLGEYTVLDVIGKGGMGEVYKAAATFSGKTQPVALKILPEHLAQQPEFRARFTREAEMLRALNHPNIVKVYSFGEANGTAYMVMDFIDGRELGDTLNVENLSLDDVRDVLHGLASALDYAHQQGLVHRDIKPSNIMIRRSHDGETWEGVLMDFGIAKIRDAHTLITGTGAIGTIEYMAPEQIVAAREVDHRADIYALGVVLYEMLTRERPFKGGAGQVLFAHLQQPPPNPCDAAGELPAQVGKAVQKALAKKPEDRFQTAGELAAALS